MSDMQKQFEEWIKTQIIKPSLAKHGAKYENQVVNECWNIWQASRAALVVELPRAEFLTQPTTDMSVWAFNVHAVANALGTAGVRYDTEGGE